MEEEEHRRIVSERVKSQFAPAYLTLTSIIQGVALSTLVIRVEATYGRFDTVDWLLVAATFLVIIDVAISTTWRAPTCMEGGKGMCASGTTHAFRPGSSRPTAHGS